MEKSRREDIRVLLIGLLIVLIPITMLFVREFGPSPPPPEPERRVPVDGLIRGEVYFYGPSDNEIRERYNGSDEERSLVLLDGRPAKFPPYDPNDPNNIFPGGDLYRMAEEFNYGRNLIEISALPEDSPIIFQYNFYYEDGTFFLVNVYPHAISINGSLYQIEGHDEGKVTSVKLLEILFWKLSAGEWP